LLHDRNRIPVPDPGISEKFFNCTGTRDKKNSIALPIAMKIFQAGSGRSAGHLTPERLNGVLVVQLRRS
jgi:hypothetical protein